MHKLIRSNPPQLNTINPGDGAPSTGHAVFHCEEGCENLTGHQCKCGSITVAARPGIDSHWVKTVCPKCGPVKMAV